MYPLHMHAFLQYYLIMTVFINKNLLIHILFTLYSVTACPQVENAYITRMEKTNFTINCTTGSEGVNRTNIYSCVDGVWKVGGHVVEPNCTKTSIPLSVVYG